MANKHEKEFLAALESATHVWRTLRRSTSGEQFIVMNGSSEIARVPSVKISDQFRKLIKATDITNTCDVQVSRRFEVVR